MNEDENEQPHASADNMPEHADIEHPPNRRAVPVVDCNGAAFAAGVDA